MYAAGLTRSPSPAGNEGDDELDAESELVSKPGGSAEHGCEPLAAASVLPRPGTPMVERRIRHSSHGELPFDALPTSPSAAASPSQLALRTSLLEWALVLGPVCAGQALFPRCLLLLLPPLSRCVQRWYGTGLLWVSVFPFTVALAKASCLAKHHAAADRLVEYNVWIALVNALTTMPTPHWLWQAVDACCNIPTAAQGAVVQHHVLAALRAIAHASLSHEEAAMLSTAVTNLLLYALQAPAEPIAAFLVACTCALPFSMWPAAGLLAESARMGRVRPHLRKPGFAERRLRVALAAYAVIVAAAAAIVPLTLARGLGGDPFVWAYDYFWASAAATPRLGIVAWWIACLVVSMVPQTTRAGARLGERIARGLAKAHEKGHGGGHTRNDSDVVAAASAALNQRRKFFHLLVVVMFAPVVSRDREMVGVALACVFAVFCCAEVVRVCALPPLGHALHRYLAGFTDARDTRGHIIISHIFLLLGIAGPVWVGGDGVGAEHILAALSGVLCLGLGDALASIVGKRFGKHRWPRTGKTVEGSLAFVAAMLIGGLTVWHAGFLGDGRVQWARFVCATLCTALLEGVSLQNDNLVIPMYMWSMLA